MSNRPRVVHRVAPPASAFFFANQLITYNQSSGAWLVLPTYMIYVMGGEIIDGLTAASTGVSVKSE